MDVCTEWFAGTTPALIAQDFGAAMAINLQNEGMVRAEQRQECRRACGPTALQGIINTQS